MKWIYLVAGGSIGTVLRYIISNAVQCRLGHKFPYGTVVVNSLGCLLAGMFLVVIEKRFLGNPDIKLFLMVAVLGAFTTFSAFIVETADLLYKGRMLAGFINILGSILLGYIFLILGMQIAKFQ
jgi:CrcB protein